MRPTQTYSEFKKSYPQSNRYDYVQYLRRMRELKKSGTSW